MREKSKKNDVLSVVWKHWKPVYAKNKWPLFGVTLFYSLGLALDALFRPTQYKKILDSLSVGNFEWGPLIYVGISLGVIWAVNRSGDFLTVFSETKIIKEFQNYAMNILLKKDTAFYTETTSGGLVAKAKRFARVSETVIDEFVYVINKAVILIIGITVYMSIMVPELMWVFIAWIGLYLVATVSLSIWRQKHDLLSSEADSTTTSKMSDIFLSITTLRVFTAVYRAREDFFSTTDDEESKRKRAWYIGNIQWAIQSILTVALEIVCMYIVIQSVRKGVHTVGTMILVQAYLASLASYMWGFGRSVIKIRTAFAEAYEMCLLLDKPNNEPVTHKVSIGLVKNSIELKNVYFKYGKGKDILSDVTIEFKAGYRYGLVGETGSGKSTITKLLLRLYDTEKGEILVGNIPIKKVNKTVLRSWIAYVPQDPQFPSWSIKDLIAMGKPNATHEEIQLAAEKASCDFIWQKLEQGFDTLVGERGIKLSGGERQRIAIAAAILKDSPIVIMDEPTSALDAKTERSIQNAIETHFKGKTLIVIAHRLATIARLDEIILLSDGKVKTKGSHKEMLETSAEFKEMWELQTTYNFSAN